MPRVMKRRMGVKFGITLGQFGQEAANVVAIHPAALQEPEDLAGVSNLASLQGGSRQCSQSMEDQPVARPIKPAA